MRRRTLCWIRIRPSGVLPLRISSRTGAEPLLQDLYVHLVLVVGLDGDGHVVFVDQQAVVRRGDLLGWDDFGVGQVTGRREEGEDAAAVRAGQGGGWVHTDNCTSWTGGSAGEQGRSSTLSTR